jgi:4-amino-4-deoxy-L-arabinose transferase-like glycosyltransferase
VYYTSAILTEILACFLAVLAVLLTTRAIKAGRVLVSVFAGIAWGLLSLCRPEYLGLTLGVVVLLAAVEWRRKAEISLVLAMVVGIVMTVSPWMLRNQLTFGSPFISTGSLGYNLFLGTFEGKYPQQGWNNLPKEVFENDSAHAEAEALVADVVSALRSGGMEVVEVDRNFMSLALDRFRTDPAGVITSWALNLPRLFYQNGGQLYRDPEPGGNYALGIFLLAILGAMTLIKQRKIAVLSSVVFCLLAILMYMPLHIEPRYGLPMMSVSVGLAGVGASVLLGALLRMIRRSLPGKRAG